MLIPEKLNTIIRILLVNSFEKKPNLQLSTLAKKTNITPAIATKAITISIIPKNFLFDFDIVITF